MKAIVIREPGSPDVLELRSDVPSPALRGGEIRVRMRATALNGADLLQRRGLYPPPAGESEILGMEVAGEVSELGPGASGVKLGDRVMALLPGGGYAEEIAMPAGMAIPIPPSLDFIQAAAIPEVFITAYLELFVLGELKRGEWVLIHAGASGVGTAAIQLAHEAGAKVIATAGSAKKTEACRAHGADFAIDYKTEDFAARVAELTEKHGADCILDLVGASHWAKNIQSLAMEGRLLLVGLGGGAKVEIDLRTLLAKRARLIASTLRARPLAEKIELTRKFRGAIMPLFESGRIKPVVDRVFPLAQAADAHRYLETQQNVGKVVLTAIS
jgi:putative PIG3 family NAD(P)H quinone oxidoreductase